MQSSFTTIPAQTFQFIVNTGNEAFHNPIGPESTCGQMIVELLDEGDGVSDAGVELLDNLNELTRGLRENKIGVPLWIAFEEKKDEIYWDVDIGSNPAGRCCWSRGQDGNHCQNYAPFSSEDSTPGGRYGS